MSKFKVGTQCCAYSCRKRKKTKHSELKRSDSEGSDDEESEKKRQFHRTFHSFPRDKVRRDLWVANMRRRDWYPNDNSRICSDHFLERFIDRKTNNVTLKQNAEPTRFKQFPEHLKKKFPKERKPPAERNVSPIPAVCETAATPAKLNNVECINLDHTYPFESQEVLKRKLDSALEEMRNLRVKLRCAQQKCRRLKQSQDNLQQVVKRLRNEQISARCEKERLSKTCNNFPHLTMNKIKAKKGAKL